MAAPHQYQAYLACFVRLQVERLVGARLDLSGVVQQTLLEASQDEPETYASWSEGQQKAWLRRLLANNLRDALKHLTAAKRGGGRDISLDASSDRLEAFLIAHDVTPSQHAIQGETLEHLLRCLDSLPEQQRLAIEWVHLQGQTLHDVARQMNKSKGAVAALLCRGMRHLRTLLKEELLCVSHPIPA